MVVVAGRSPPIRRRSRRVRGTERAVALRWTSVDSPSRADSGKPAHGPVSDICHDARTDCRVVVAAGPPVAGALPEASRRAFRVMLAADLNLVACPGRAGSTPLSVGCLGVLARLDGQTGWAATRPSPATAGLARRQQEYVSPEPILPVSLQSHTSAPSLVSGPAAAGHRRSHHEARQSWVVRVPNLRPFAS